MKINWKIRGRNPHFWLQIALSILAPVFAYNGISGQDLTTWKAVGDLALGAVSNPYVLSLIGVSVWNAVADPTTPGVNDSYRALTYKKPGGK